MIDVSRTSTKLKDEMADGEWCSVGILSQRLQATPSTVGYALKRMHEAELVETKSDKGILWYKLV